MLLKNKRNFVSSAMFLLIINIFFLIPSEASATVCPTLRPGDQVKVQGFPTIYAVNSNNEVMSFGAGDVYKSWRSDDRYSGYITITSECYDSLSSPNAQPLYINFRPGSYLIKREGSSQLYVVLPGNTKAKITSQVARALYSSSFVLKTIPLSRWASYVNNASDITLAIAHEGMLVMRPNDSKTYYVDNGNVLREVAVSGLVANRFKKSFVRKVAGSAVAGFSLGEPITGEVAEIADLTQSGVTVTPASPVARIIPPFIFAMRTSWPNPAIDDFQLNAVNDLGMRYVQGTPSFIWLSGESGSNGNVYKWSEFDGHMNKLAARGQKVIAFLMLPKLAGLHWNQSILRTDPRYRAEYEEYAYEIVNRYKNHPAWSGIVSVWGASSDVWGGTPFNEPEVEIPLLNAAYDGIKRADPNTIVVGFNMATTFTDGADWEQWHRRAFNLSPKFDWFGIQTHSVPVGAMHSDNIYGGMMGLMNIRRFLDERGYADKPIFQNEGGFHIFNSIFNQQSQAEQAVETFVTVRALNINIKGWVYFTMFGTVTSSSRCGANEDGDNWGIMSCAVEPYTSLPQPRPAYRALQTLFNTVDFDAYNYEATESSFVANQIAPFVFRFVKATNQSTKLWVVFSPRSISGAEPSTQNVSINISPALQAIKIEILGNQSAVQADASGNISVQSTASPVFIRVGQ